MCNSFILYDILNGAELIQIKENITIFFFSESFLAPGSLKMSFIKIARQSHEYWFMLYTGVTRDSM